MPRAPWLEVCPPRPSIPATRRDLGGWWVRSRCAPLPGGALAAAARHRLNGTPTLPRLSRFDPGDDRWCCYLSKAESFICPHGSPKVPRQQFLPRTPLVGRRAPRSGRKGRGSRPGLLSTSNSNLGLRGLTLTSAASPARQLVLEGALNAPEGGLKVNGSTSL